MASAASATCAGGEEVPQYIFTDAIPLRDLERIARFEEEAADLDRRARSMTAKAGNYRDMAEAIRQHYQEEVRVHGLAACVARSQALDDRYWNEPVVRT